LANSKKVKKSNLDLFLNVMKLEVAEEKIDCILYMYLANKVKLKFETNYVNTNY